MNSEAVQLSQCFYLYLPMSLTQAILFMFPAWVAEMNGKAVYSPAFKLSSVTVVLFMSCCSLKVYSNLLACNDLIKLQAVLQRNKSGSSLLFHLILGKNKVGSICIAVHGCWTHLVSLVLLACGEWDPTNLQYKTSVTFHLPKLTKAIART